MNSTPRHQIFVSSTFRDLIEERRAALEAVLELGHFPAGMELFPAADDGAFSVVRRVLEESDYYVLILAGRYGSLAPDGVGYTEKEYALAVERKTPILPFLHAEPEALCAKHTEQTEAGREKLARFRERLVARHHCNFWTSGLELKSKIIVSLTGALRNHPREGWIKAGDRANPEHLVKIVQLQDEIALLKAELERLQPNEAKDRGGPTYAGGDDPIPLWKREPKPKPDSLQTTLTWNALFVSVAQVLTTDVCFTQTLEEAISRAIDERLHGRAQARQSRSKMGAKPRRLIKTPYGDLPAATAVVNQFQVLGLLTKHGLTTKLTPQGLEHYLRLTAVRAVPSPTPAPENSPRPDCSASEPEKHEANI